MVLLTGASRPGGQLITLQQAMVAATRKLQFAPKLS